jgi:hypothetical protein
VSEGAAYTLREICQIVGIDEGFAAELVREEILVADVTAAGDDGMRYSALMLERARVAHELVDVLEVNLAGAAVIVRMREQMVFLRRGVRELARALDRARPG